MSDGLCEYSRLILSTGKDWILHDSTAPTPLNYERVLVKYYRQGKHQIVEMIHLFLLFNLGG